MENKHSDPLFYEKLRTAFLGAILLVLLALLIGAAAFVIHLRQYETRIGGIVDRLDTVSSQLQELDVENIVSTANEVTAAIDQAKVDEIVSSLSSVSRQLSEVDWVELTDNINTVATDAQASLADAQEALQKVKDLDIESLNQAITDLQAVVEPLAAFTKRFG